MHRLRRQLGSLAMGARLLHSSLMTVRPSRVSSAFLVFQLLASCHNTEVLLQTSELKFLGRCATAAQLHLQSSRAPSSVFLRAYWQPMETMLRPWQGTRSSILCC